MLTLRVYEGDYIMINDDIKIRVEKTGHKFTMSIDAPREYTILRQSLYEAQNPGAVDRIEPAAVKAAAKG